MILNLPYDIKWSIANYIDDIDIRRYFDIYKKINLNNFNILNRTIRKNMGENMVGNFTFTRCNFHENYENSNNVTICNDYMDIFINIFDTKVYYKLCIYKFKNKNKEYKYYNHQDNFEDYYWESITVEYIIN